MRVLFVEDIFSGTSIRGEPLSIMQLSSILKAGGHETDLVDVHSIKEIRKKIKEFNPGILAYSIRTGFHRNKFAVNLFLKKENKDLFSVFGGSHATFFPECIHEDGVDAVCVGEGDFVLLELCDRIQRREDITSIKNLWVKIGENIFKNEVRPLVEDLDSLPVLDRDILYRHDLKRYMPIKTVIASRGCPFSCSYCYSGPLKKIYGNKGELLRRCSPEKIILEIENLRKYGHLKYLFFEDDIFTYDKSWLISFSKLYKTNIGIPFCAYTHVHYLDKEIVSYLKEANCHQIGLGVESADYGIRKEILNREMSNDDIESACSLLRSHGIMVCLGYILGIPGGSLEKDIDTLRFHLKLKPELASVSSMYPFPRTKMEEIVSEKGYKILPTDDFGSMRAPGAMINIEQKKEIERLQLLFPIVAKLPFLMKFIKVLIRLPFKPGYYLLSKLDKIYAFRWLLKLKLDIREVITCARSLLFYMRRKEI